MLLEEEAKEGGKNPRSNIHRSNTTMMNGTDGNDADPSPEREACPASRNDAKKSKKDEDVPLTFPQKVKRILILIIVYLVWW